MPRISSRSVANGSPNPEMRSTVRMLTTCLLLAPRVLLIPAQLDCVDLAPRASKGLQLLLRKPTSPGWQGTSVSTDCCQGTKPKDDEIRPGSRKLETYKGKPAFLLGQNSITACACGGTAKPALCARAIALRAGRGHMALRARIVGLGTALLLSGLGHFLSQGPTFLIYKL